MAFSISRFYRMFCTQSTTQTPQSIKVLIQNLYKERNLSKVVEDFKGLSETSRFRGKHLIYENTIQRLASAKKFLDIEEVLEYQKQYEDITHEGFTVRLISLYGKAGMFDHASKLFDEMPQLKCERTVKSFNALLQACVQSKKFSKAEKLFRELPSSLSITPDERSYNICVRALCKMKSLDSAELMLDEMERNGLQPTVITYNTIMNAFYSTGRFSDGERIWARLEKSGIAPDLFSFNSKLTGFLRRGKIAEALELLKELKSRELKPDVITYNTLITWCCNDRDLEKAKALYEFMLIDCCVPNRTTFQALIPLFCKNGDFDLALKLCEESQSLFCSIDVRILQTLVNGLAKESKVEEAEKLVKLIQSNSKGRSKLQMPAKVE